MKSSEIEAYIRDTGLTQHQVAARLDVRHETLNRWVSGKQSPAHPEMLRAALNYLILDQYARATDSTLENLIKRYRQGK